MTLWTERARSLSLPAAIVDLDALDANIDALLALLGDHGATIRVASKSIRIPEALRYVQERAGARVRGVMAFHAYEARWLFDNGIDDLLMGYPCAREDEARRLASIAADGGSVWPTVDDPAQLKVLSDAALGAKTELTVCIDIDASWRPLNGKAHLGVRRSPLHGAAETLRLADAIRNTPGLRLDAVLSYEAQIAGMQDTNRGSRHLDPIRALIKRGSRPAVMTQRASILEALRAAGHTISLVNGGGTGSLDWTAGDPSVTEVTVGSGFFCPHLFDGYRQLSLKPAAFGALSVVRRPAPSIVTCAGGGYLASGAIGDDRAPIVHHPAGLTPLAMEGWGEVQTPLQVPPGVAIPEVGDAVFFRHAKAGELFERFGDVHLFRGPEAVGTWRSYRGHGLSFM